jgi:hypothetical protein
MNVDVKPPTLHPQRSGTRTQRSGTRTRTRTNQRRFPNRYVSPAMVSLPASRPAADKGIDARTDFQAC